MSNGSAKQKVVQSIKDVTNILVTVSSSPSVDELSAALGLTIFLNKLGKHTTAVFSGDIPPAITFLNPDKTFEQTTDSLRDFIIALDKEKADHLRYKLVDDAVKIFITPYRTTISDKDLEFSQGDYNVELVLALNVENGESIDTALTAHGKILHDATVISITAGDVKSGLGSVDWHEGSTSGVSEMIVELINDLKTPKVTLDEQMATALLTGIVAVTERFSNDNTSSKVMTAAAELMAAGANQQLVISKIAESETEDKPKEIEQVKKEVPAKDKDDSSEDKADEVEEAEESEQADGTLSISHEKKGDVDEVAEQTVKEKQEESARVAEEKLANIEPIKEEIRVEEEQPSEKIVSKELSFEETPLMGGTLNATTTQAAEDKIRALASDQNKTILTHSKYVGDSTPSFGDTPLNAAMGASDEPPKIDPFATTNAEQRLSTIPVAPQSDESIIAAITNDTNQLSTPLAVEPNQVGVSPEPVLAAPLQPENTANEISLPMPPAIPDFGALPPMPPAPTGVDASGLPQLSPLGVAPEPVAAEVSPVPALPTQPIQNTGEFNPGQFQIPGQK